jgi:hypothetical protein
LVSTSIHGARRRRLGRACESRLRSAIGTSIRTSLRATVRCTITPVAPAIATSAATAAASAPAPAFAILRIATGFRHRACRNRRLRVSVIFWLGKPLIGFRLQIGF